MGPFYTLCTIGSFQVLSLQLLPPFQVLSFSTFATSVLGPCVNFPPLFQVPSKQLTAYVPGPFCTLTSTAFIPGPFCTLTALIPVLL